MSTRSLICIQKGNEIDTKYCHWDGYPSNNGVLLFENYKEEHEVEELLVNDEYISSLGETVEDTSYGGEQQNTSYSREDNIQLFLEEDLINDADNCWAEYIYLFKNGEWYVAECYEETKKCGFVLLEVVLDNDGKIPHMKTI
jgi:hypothetical protein